MLDYRNKQFNNFRLSKITIVKKIQFSIDINAPKEKVWHVLWNDAIYRKWTSVFSEGSKAVSDWKEGSKIHFLNENNYGMYST